MTPCARRACRDSTGNSTRIGRCSIRSRRTALRYSRWGTMRPGLSVERIRGRQSLLEEMEQASNARVRGRDSEALGRFRRKAVAIMNSGRARAAFDLSKESDAVRARYGPTIFGTSALIGADLSRRA